ncbi:hypothetical protein BJ322DRAFT_1171128 [Thelephora terrestris]|uniref:Uncharacterized protein n=1 Tax=Thelephora terrestris TaxID=56493 RepID=A0A9P6LBU8_9AGAM|nr:hypothetical protein BJ322DRAFT_1171128 [Thelephora terrestris]
MSRYSGKTRRDGQEARAGFRETANTVISQVAGLSTTATPFFSFEVPGETIQLARSQITLPRGRQEAILLPISLEFNPQRQVTGLSDLSRQTTAPTSHLFRHSNVERKEGDFLKEQRRQDPQQQRPGFMLRLSGRRDLYSSIALLLSKPFTLRGQTHSYNPVANPGISEVSSQT